MKVVVTKSGLTGYDWHEEAAYIKKELGAELDFKNTYDHEILKAACAECDAVVTGYAQIDADIIAAMTKCKVISKLGIGVDNVDVEAATKKGIYVLNETTYCTEEVSDTVVALFYSMARCIPFVRDNVQAGNWSRGDYMPVRIKGKTFGFLGFGNIARRACEKLNNCGMTIIAYDPYLPQEKADALGVKLCSMDEVLEDSDFVSVNMPLNAETHGMINKDVFKKMKNTAVLINTARGGLVNEPELVEALKNKEISGAALDVLCKDEYEPGNPLYDMPNVLVTPHLAYSSPESIVELRTECFADVVRVLKGEEPKFWYNKRQMTK